LLDEIYEAESRLEQAARQFELALAFNPENQRIRQDLARVRQRIGSRT
jgi:Flp pilus assembly protein TadD